MHFHACLTFAWFDTEQKRNITYFSLYWYIILQIFFIRLEYRHVWKASKMNFTTKVLKAKLTDKFELKMSMRGSRKLSEVVRL